MIDFTKLKQTNPISFRLFESWIEKQHGTTLLFFTEKITNEEIVEFLDENRIFIDISCFLEYEKSEDVYFGFEIYSCPKWTHDDRYYPRRDESTSNGIIKAFELLEAKLKIN